MWSNLYPGNRHTVQCLQPAVLAAQSALDLSAAQRQRTVWRLDGGAGSDAQLRFLFQLGYHVVAKGLSNRRAVALAKQAKRWDAYKNDSWLAEVAPPMDYGRPVQVCVKKRHKNGTYVYSYYVTSLSFPSKRAFLHCYDARGGAEVEQFRNDKSGLNLEARRKSNFTGQLAYILLTDIAHNLLTDFRRRVLSDSPLSSLGPKRIVRDLLALPGSLTFHDGELVHVGLASQLQFSQHLVNCLNQAYCNP